MAENQTETAPTPKISLIQTSRMKVSMIVTKPSQEEISKRAWEIWQAEGCPQGRETENWLRAEAEILSRAKGAILN
jgi:hypothetical protein